MSSAHHRGASACTHPYGASLSVGRGEEGLALAPRLRTRKAENGLLGTGRGLPGAGAGRASGTQANWFTRQIARPVTSPCTRSSTCSTATPTGTSGPSGTSATWCGRLTSASPGDRSWADWRLECRSQPPQGWATGGTGEGGGPQTTWEGVTGGFPGPRYSCARLVAPRPAHILALRPPGLLTSF